MSADNVQTNKSDMWPSTISIDHSSIAKPARSNAAHNWGHIKQWLKQHLLDAIVVFVQEIGTFRIGSRFHGAYSYKYNASICYSAAFQHELQRQDNSCCEFCSDIDMFGSACVKCIYHRDIINSFPPSATYMRPWIGPQLASAGLLSTEHLGKHFIEI